MYTKANMQYLVLIIQIDLKFCHIQQNLLLKLAGSQFFPPCHTKGTLFCWPPLPPLSPSLHSTPSPLSSFTLPPHPSFFFWPDADTNNNVVRAFDLSHQNFTYFENFTDVATIYSYSGLLPNGADLHVSLLCHFLFRLLFTVAKFFMCAAISSKFRCAIFRSSFDLFSISTI